jgi:hypothetical protein
MKELTAKAGASEAAFLAALLVTLLFQFLLEHPAIDNMMKLYSLEETSIGPYKEYNNIPSNFEELRTLTIFTSITALCVAAAHGLGAL